MNVFGYKNGEWDYLYTSISQPSKYNIRILLAVLHILYPQYQSFEFNGW